MANVINLESPISHQQREFFPEKIREINTDDILITGIEAKKILKMKFPDALEMEMNIWLRDWLEPLEKKI